jgi:hypothetical protein
MPADTGKNSEIGQSLFYFCGLFLRFSLSADSRSEAGAP